MPINVNFDTPTTPPSSTDKINFRLRYDAFLAYIQSLGTKLINFVTQINDLEANVNAKESSASASAASAAASANFQGTYTNQTTSVGQSWYFNGVFYKVLIAGNTSPAVTPANWAPTTYKECTLGTPIASAATTIIGTTAGGDTVHITGTTTITSFGTTTSANGLLRIVVFDGALTLTHNATSLILPTGANIITAAGDIAEFVCENTTLGYWRCTGYQRKDGTALKTNALTFSDIPTGGVIQVANYSTGTVATGTALVPIDNTNPQNTEGTQFMSLAFTPKKATSKLKIEAVSQVGTNVLNWVVSALYQDANVNAIGVGMDYISTAGAVTPATVSCYIDAVNTSARTFYLRLGQNSAGTLTFNGNSSGGTALFGGSLVSSITITEIAQ